MAAFHTLVLFVVLACDSLVAHPTLYPHITAKRGKTDGKRALPYPPPGIISYHIHITYTLFNPPVCMLHLKIHIFSRATISGRRRSTETSSTHTCTVSRLSWTGLPRKIRLWILVYD